MYQLPKCLLSMSTGVLFEGAFSLWVFLICFSWEIKGFYQISWGNEVDFTDMMYIFSKISAQNWNFKKMRDAILSMKEQWLQRHWYRPVNGKPLYLFACEENPEKTFVTLTVNYCKILQKTIYAIQNNSKLAI